MTLSEIQNRWGSFRGINYDWGNDKAKWLEKNIPPSPGKVIVDIGCGDYPITDLLQKEQQHRIIQVNAVFNDSEAGKNTFKIEVDIEEIGEESEEIRKALSAVAEFLGIQCKESPDPEQIDIMVFSEVLNYVDFRNVLKNFLKYLKKGGKIFIVNMPKMGHNECISPLGIQNNTELMEALQENNIRIVDAIYEYPGLKKSSLFHDYCRVFLIGEKL